MNTKGKLEEAIDILRQHNGILRTQEMLDQGIHPRTIYAMRDAGIVDRLGRGLYRLAELPPLCNPDLVTVALKVTRGVICLVSALAFHELTTQVPHAVDIALQKGDERPRLDYPPLRVYWFSGPAWTEGVETHLIDQTTVRIYSAAKSVADSFKFRRQIGTDVAVEALRTYRKSSIFAVDELLRYARICRVDKIVRPYLEALL